VDRKCIWRHEVHLRSMLLSSVRDFENVCKSIMACTNFDRETLMKFWFSAMRG